MSAKECGTPEMTGIVEVQKVRSKSTVTRCFSKYPLKFIVPNKVGSSDTDVVWIYSLSYGGGIVSGDRIDCSIKVGDGCTAVLTTQASTKVYKAVGSSCSEQTLDVKIGKGAFLACIPDPVTCFASARYIQKQVFEVAPNSSLLVVDWLTSGRHESGEKWSFQLYKSSNHVFLEGGHPLFIDSVLLGQDSHSGIVESMCDYQVNAMVVLLGPKLERVGNQIQEQVKMMMSGNYRSPRSHLKSGCDDGWSRPSSPAVIASCSAFGAKPTEGLVVRIVALTTESVYEFLRCQLADIEPIIGVIPYQ